MDPTPAPTPARAAPTASPTAARWLAAVIAVVYGFAKLNGAQFTVLDSELTRPLGEVSGFWLTWYYLGYSPVYGTLIAVLQIAGGLLLLWPRWALAGALLLLPVVANIVLVDILFGVDLSGLLTAVVFFVCVVAIIRPHLPRLRAAVVPTHNVERRPLLRFAAMLVLVAMAWGLTWWVANVNNRLPTPIDGTWVSHSDSTSEVETSLFFERTRAHLLVIREGMHDDRFHFTMDSSGVVRVYRHWLRPDSVIRTGRYHGGDTLALWHPAHPDSPVRYVRIAPPGWRR